MKKYRSVLMQSSKPRHRNPESRIEINIIFKDGDGSNYRIANECTHSEKKRFRVAKKPNLSFSKKMSTSSPRLANYSLENLGSTSHLFLLRNRNFGSRKHQICHFSEKCQLAPPAERITR